MPCWYDPGWPLAERLLVSPRLAGGYDSFQVPVEEQMRTLMRGVEFGDPHIQATMEAELRTRLAEGRPLRVYCGFDPTAVDLTLGHMVPMFKMRQFQRFGHDVTFLIGTMTGMIGDPTDRSAARTMLTAEQVNANAETWQSPGAAHPRPAADDLQAQQHLAGADDARGHDPARVELHRVASSSRRRASASASRRAVRSTSTSSCTR